MINTILNKSIDFEELYEVNSFTEKFVFLYGCNHGRFERIMVRRDSETGEISPRLHPVRNFRPGIQEYLSKGGIFVLHHIG